MRRIILLPILLLLFPAIQAQGDYQRKVDSLIALVPKKKDTALINLNNQISTLYIINLGEDQKALPYLSKNYSLIQRYNYPKGEYMFYVLRGTIAKNERQFTDANNNFSKALNIAKKHESDQLKIAQIYASLARTYADEFRITKATEYFFKALRICEKESKINLDKFVVAMNDRGYNYTDKTLKPKHIIEYQKKNKNDKEITKLASRGSTVLGMIRSIYLNLSEMFLNIKDYNKAMVYGKMAEANAESVGARDSYLRILKKNGEIYAHQNKWDSSLYYNKKCLRAAQSMGNHKMVIEAYDGIGLAYTEKKEFEKVKPLYDTVRNLLIEFNEMNPFIEAMLNSRIGQIEIKQGHFKEAKKLFEDALVLLEGNSERNHHLRGICKWEYGNVLIELGESQKALTNINEAVEVFKSYKDYENIIDATYSLHRAYLANNNYKEALKVFKDYVNLKDSIFSQQNANLISQMQRGFELEGKDTEITKLNIDKKAQEFEIERQKTLRNSMFVGVGLVILVLFVLWRSYRNKKKANILLAHQKLEIQEKSEQLEIVYKEVKDSIHYAKRIQEAILPQHDVLHSFFSQSFVLYKPKDVVSGDFYSFFQKENELIVVTADCTGHGVPGAFMSMIGNEQLNKIIVEKGIIVPNQILDELHIGIRRALKQDQQSGETRDGMDIAVCKFSKVKNEVQYAGANRMLWIIRNDELIEISPDKQPIGGLDTIQRKSFTNHTIPLQSGDRIYTFTDGYADQFGGEKGKKFMVKNLERQLISMKEISMNEQHDHLMNVYENWKGHHEQIDDVCLIGIQIP